MRMLVLVGRVLTYSNMMGPGKEGVAGLHLPHHPHPAHTKLFEIAETDSKDKNHSDSGEKWASGRLTGVTGPGRSMVRGLGIDTTPLLLYWCV